MEVIPGAKLLAITGASNVTGELLDITRVQKILNQLPVRPLWLLDGSQRFPHERTSIRDSGIDIFVGTGHKVMSDTGIGFIAAKKDILQTLIPAFCGGGAINAVTRDYYEPAGLPFRHEPGTPHIVGAVSLLAALEYIESIGGYDAIHTYEQTLVEYALEQMKSLSLPMRLI